QPQFTFTGPGSYTVTLRAINSCGTFPVDQVVTVGAAPQVSVNAVNGICEGQSVTPSATFTPCGTPITGYSWALPGGVPASANTQNLGGIVYPSSGNFNITATANSACGNTTASTPLSVTPLPAAPVVGGPITLCVGETLTLTATPVPGITFNWIGPNGFTSTSASPSIPNITLANQGLYSVSASAGGCNGPSSTITVTVNPAPVVNISPTVPTVCAGSAVTLTASGGTNYQWTAGGVNIGSGTPFSFTPTTTTTVVLNGDAGGCTGASSTLVTVHPLPVVDAGPDRVFCESNVAQMLFPDTYPGTWSGDPNVTANGYFTPSTQGTFQLTYTVISPQGCPNTDVIQVTVNPPSTPASAGPDTLLCQNAGAIQLFGTPAGGTWSGDISLGGLFNPAITGTFTVTYFVGTGSCSSTDQAIVTVVPAPTVNPGQDQQVCIDAPAITLSATPVGGSWSGAGISGNQFDPQAAGAGQHALSYTYADPNGCSATGIRTIRVNPLPVVFAGNDITFCDQPFAQTLAGYSPLGGTWSGTGVTAGGSFTPSGPGTFDLVYDYSDVNGCSASDQMQVTVITIDDPATAGNDTTLCLNSGQLQLTGGPTGGAWSGSHVDVDGLFDPALDGPFTLTYSVGTGSCVTQDQVEITVLPLPVINITSMDDACIDAGEQTFTATPPGGTWSGTGITDAALGTFDPVVSDVGIFTITYIYTDASGCTNSTTGDVEVNPLPTAAFSNDPTACTNVPFHFTNESTGASSWSWDFGNTMTSADQSPDHIYTTAGSYTATLTASSAAGCTNTISHDVTVWAGPTVGFDLSPFEGCGPLEVLLDNQSFGDGVTYDWDLGDGTGSTLEQPGQNTYAATLTGDATYTIVLTATNYCGSVDSMRTVTVHPSPTAIFGPDFDFGCSPWPVTFSNVTIGQADNYFWDFGDGLTSTTTDSLVQHTYYAGAEDTTYTITLVATNDCGSDTANYTITTLPNTITAFFNTDTTSGCAPLTVNFTQYSIGVTNWHWNLGNGEVSTDADITTTYDTAGTYTATLYGDNGCSFDTVSVQIVVLDSPPADFDITPGLFCVGTPIQFTNNTPSPAGLTWDLGDGNTSSLSAPVHSYADPGSYNVTLSVVSTMNACPAVLTQTVNVLTTPVATFAPDPASGCIPLVVQFTNGSTSADFHQWNFDDGNTTSAPNPTHTFTAAGTYNVQLIAENLNGCTDTTSGCAPLTVNFT
ncbi:MAG: PKD domain-containing protein, partial [Flavobacteriales bacterium]